MLWSGMSASRVRRQSRNTQAEPLVAVGIGSGDEAVEILARAGARADLAAVEHRSARP
jgi:hypothetical protein